MVHNRVSIHCAITRTNPGTRVSVIVTESFNKANMAANVNKFMTTKWQPQNLKSIKV